MFEIGILSLIVLAFDIWAILKTIDSAASTGAKVFWILLIVIMPVLGFLIWLLAGPRPGR